MLQYKYIVNLHIKTVQLQLQYMYTVNLHIKTATLTLKDKAITLETIMTIKII